MSQELSPSIQSYLWKPLRFLYNAVTVIMRAVIVAPVLRRLNGTTTAALFLIVLLYFTAVFNVVIPWYNYSVSGATHLLVLSCTTALGFYCYLACVYVDPGRVPKGWQPDLEEPKSPTLQEVKSNGSHRYCAKCESFKPPRTHHCRRCGRCVLRMDHHCIWVNNCIGHGNYRCFLLMCVYLATAAVHAAGLLYCYDLHLLSTLSASWQEERRARRAAALLRRAAIARPGGGGDAAAASAELAGTEGSGAPRFEWQGPFWVHAAAQVAASAVALPVSLALLALLLWNLHLLLHNKTTVEHHEGVRLQSVSDASPAAGPPSSSGGHLLGPAEGVGGGGMVAAAAGAGSVPASGGSGEGSGSVGLSPPQPPSGPLLLKSPSPRGQPQPQRQQQGAQQGQQGDALLGQGPSGALVVRRLKEGQHPYDLGPLDNLHEVCGDWEALWCLPVRHGAAGSGLAFATGQGQRRRRAAAAAAAM